LDFLLSAVPSLRPFGVGLLDVAGLTLCESLRSDLDLPLYTAALTDGWAVRSSNLVGASPEHPIALPVVGAVGIAGIPAEPLSPGTTVRVSYGGPVPEGADAVVAANEAVEIRGTGELPDGVRFISEVAHQQYLYPKGERIADNDPLLPSGTVINPRMVSMLAEVGHDKVLARPRPRVVVATIGEELVSPGLPLTRVTQVYDSTTVLIAAAAGADQAQVFPIGILPDDKAVLVSKLNEQLVRADLVLLVAKSTGPLMDALSELGALDVADVAMWPNGPRLFAKIGPEQVPVLVLPEGAIQSYIGYLVFGRPLLRKLAGQDPLGDVKLVSAASERVLPVDEDHAQFILGVHNADRVEALNLPADAGGLELARANALISVEPGQQVDIGDQVSCWLLDGQ
jgi:molybdopterin molybdotransferase